MSMLRWTIVDTGKATAEKNMSIDAELLEHSFSLKGPILHLYDWEKPSATYGHFLDPYQFIQRDAASKLGLQLARRPTGGGMIFHLTDLAFSMIVPAGHPGYSINVLDNYAFVNQLVIEAVKRFTNDQIRPELLSCEPEVRGSVCKHFCMAKPTKFDVMLGARKVGGGAQRRTRHGFLHQGSISLGLPPIHLLSEVLISQEGLIDAMQSVTYALLPAQLSEEELKEARRRMAQLLIGVVSEK